MGSRVMVEYKKMKWNLELGTRAKGVRWLLARLVPVIKRFSTFNRGV